MLNIVFFWNIFNEFFECIADGCFLVHFHCQTHRVYIVKILLYIKNLF